MKFQDGELVTLGGDTYRIQERLGRGAISNVYLALLNDLPDAPVVLKVVRDDAADDPLKVKALQREAEVLTVLNHAEDTQWLSLSNTMARLRYAKQSARDRKVIGLLNAGESEFGKPYLIQELAPPRFKRFDVETLEDECLALSIAQAIAEVIALAHHHNLALKDFAPDTKGDRIRLEWLDDGSKEFTIKIIDWNVTGGPEVMEKDLFFLGGHLYYILTGRHVPLDKERHPPINLGMGNPAWDDLTEGSRLLMGKALHRDPKRRYAQADILLADMAWWCDTLSQLGSASIFQRLDDRLWQARSVGRHDRVLAVADLALRLDPPADVQRSFEKFFNQAREELDKAIWLPIAKALVSIGTRAYEKAALELAKETKNLSPESPAARLARIYQLFARVGREMKQQSKGTDERRTLEWETLETRAIPALAQRRWQDAQDALSEVIQQRPEVRTWTSFQRLMSWARAGTRYTSVVNTAFMDAENRQDPADPAWLQVEGDKIQAHEKALEALDVMKKDAPFEPEFEERSTLERGRLVDRKKFFGLYKESDISFSAGRKALDDAHQVDGQGKYQEAAEFYQIAISKFLSAHKTLREILHDDGAQRRAQIFVQRTQRYLEEAKRLREQAKALQQAKERLQTGEYVEALKVVQEVLQSTPNREDARLLHVEAEIGTRLLRVVRGSLQSAQTYLDNADFDAALEYLQRFKDWDGRPLRDLPGGESLPAMVEGRPFCMRTDLRIQAGDLREQIQVLREEYRQEQEKALKQATERLRSGEYVEALQAVQGVLPSAFNQEEAHLLRAIAEIGIRLLREVQESLQSAQTYLDNADFDTALEYVQRFQGWDGHPLQDLPGGESLPPMVKGFPFRLRTDLRVQAGDLREQIRVLREEYQAIQPAREDQDYAEVVARYEDLLERKYKLPRELHRQWEEAREYLAGRSAARSLLEGSETFDDLRKVLRILEGDEGREAEMLRQRTADRWLLLTKRLAQTELAQLVPHLKEGLRRFGTRSESIFTSMLTQAERAVEVARRLDSPGAGGLDWLGKLGWQTELARLSEDLDALTSPETWLEMRQRAGAWRAELKHCVEQFVQEELGKAQDQSAQNNFIPARLILRDLWQGLPDSLRDSLPGDIRSKVQGLEQALEQRLEAEEALVGILNRLGREETFTFREAAREVGFVLEDVRSARHDKVSIAIIEDKFSALRKMAEIELVLNSIPVPDLDPEEGQRNYAQLLQSCRQLSVANMSDFKRDLLVGHSQELRKRVDDLQSRLRHKRQEIVNALREVLGRAVKEQRQQPYMEPHRVLALYAQARWAEALDGRRYQETQEAHKLPGFTLERAAEALAELDDLTPPSLIEQQEPEILGPDEKQAGSGIERETVTRGPLSLLQRAETINNKMIHLPLEQLPPLPEKASLAEESRSWQLPAGSLAAFNEELRVLQNLLQAALQFQVQEKPEPVSTTEASKSLSEETPPAEELPAAEESLDAEEDGPTSAGEISTLPYDSTRVTAVQSLARDIEESVKRLRELWKALDLDLEWDENSPLAQLEHEAVTQQAVAERLTEAYRLLQDNQAMQGLDSLYETLEKPGLMKVLDGYEMTWLAHPRQVLKWSFDALRQRLIGALGRQIAGILDLSNAAVELQQQILIVPKSLWLAQAAYRAIYQGIDQRARQAEAEGRKDAAQRLWRIVLDATESAPEGKIQQDVSEDLDESQKGQGRSRASLRKRRGSKKKEPKLPQKSPPVSPSGSLGAAQKPELREPTD